MRYTVSQGHCCSKETSLSCCAKSCNIICCNCADKCLPSSECGETINVSAFASLFRRKRSDEAISNEVSNEAAIRFAMLDKNGDGVIRCQIKKNSAINV